MQEKGTGSRRQLEWARFEPRSGRMNKKTPKHPPPTPHNPQTTMLSIALRNSIARRVSATATPMLGRAYSDTNSEGSVAQSQGFRSVSPCGFRDLAELLTLRLQKEGKGPRGCDTAIPTTSSGSFTDVPAMQTSIRGGTSVSSLRS